LSKTFARCSCCFSFLWVVVQQHQSDVSDRCGVCGTRLFGLVAVGDGKVDNYLDPSSLQTRISGVVYGSLMGRSVEGRTAIRSMQAKQ